MSKLTAAIRNPFVAAPYADGKVRSSRSARRILAAIMQRSGIAWALLHTPLRLAAIETVNVSLHEPDPSHATQPMLYDSALASLASKAPGVCSRLRGIRRSQAQPYTSFDGSPIQPVRSSSNIHPGRAKTPM